MARAINHEARAAAVAAALENPSFTQAQVTALINRDLARPVSPSAVSGWLQAAGLTKGRGRSTAAEVEDFDAALVQIVEEIHPTGCRSVFYQAVARGLVEKTEQAAQRVGKRLIALRDVESEDGTPDPAFPIDWIVDGIRRVRRPWSVMGPEEAVEAIAHQYRRQLWVNQDYYPVVAIEKAGLAGVFEPITDEWDVPLVPLQGFGSISLAWQVAKICEAQPLPVRVIYLGDHDPSGKLIDPAFERRLRRYGPNLDLSFERIAIRPEQVEQYQLPTRPTKSDQKNRHAKGWQGGDSVELDAMPTPILRTLLTEAIESLVNPGALASMRAAEESERDLFLRMANRDFAGLVQLMDDADRNGW